MNKLLYNTTYHVDFTILDEWLQWMVEEFIPHVLTSDGFENHKLLKIMSDENQSGVSFALQITVQSLNKYIEYQEGLKKELTFMLRSKWGESCLSFATLMEICDES